MSEEKQPIPLFTLSAQDELCTKTVRTWIDLAERAGVSTDKLNKAYEALGAILEWQKNNPDGVRLPD